MTVEPDAVGDYPGVYVEYFDGSHRYKVNHEFVPSVTTVLGVLNKPLESYIERETLKGAWKLIAQARDPEHPYHLPRNGAPRFCPSQGKNYAPFFARECHVPEHDCALGDPRICAFRQDLKRRHLDSRSATNEAAERGTDVHQVWQDWNEHHKIPNAEEYPENRRGYIRSMGKAILQLKPHAVEVEAVVGSAVHGYAGRLDTVVVVHTADGLSMIDLKTSSSIWANSYYPQLAGYEIARRECGLPATARQGILHLDKSGEFDIERDLAWSDAEPEDFLAVLGAWKSQRKWAK